MKKSFNKILEDASTSSVHKSVEFMTKTVLLPKAIYRFYAIYTKIPMSFFI